MKATIYELTLSITLMFFVTASYAEWENSKKIDEMTDATKCSLSITNMKRREGEYYLFTTVGFTEHTEPDGKVVRSIVSSFRDEPRESSGMFRVDSNKAIVSDFSLHKGSQHHFAYNNYDSFISQMKKGMTLKVSSGLEVVEISLIGFTKSYNEYIACTNSNS